jgi:hypothetical protein
MRCKAKSKRSSEQCKKDAVRGREVCHIHGGKSLVGINSPTFKHGRFSKSVPARLSESYHEMLSDPNKLALENELAVLVARNEELLAALDSKGSARLFKRLRDTMNAMDRASRDPRTTRERSNAKAENRHSQKQAELLNELRRMILRGASEAERWDELRENMEQQRKLAESERKRLVESHQVATVEEIMAFMGGVLAILKKHITDKRVLRAIGNDIDALVNGGETNSMTRPGEDETGERS